MGWRRNAWTCRCWPTLCWVGAGRASTPASYWLEAGGRLSGRWATCGCRRVGSACGVDGFWLCADLGRPAWIDSSDALVDRGRAQVLKAVAARGRAHEPWTST